MARVYATASAQSGSGASLRGVGRPDDLALLPEDVRATAEATPGAEEFNWPLGDAERAINALAETGFLILGLDVRRYDGGTCETAWSAFEPDRSASARVNIEQSRRAALQALQREDTPEFGDWILITWERPDRLLG